MDNPFSITTPLAPTVRCAGILTGVDAERFYKIKAKLANAHCSTKSVDIFRAALVALESELIKQGK